MNDQNDIYAPGRIPTDHNLEKTEWNKEDPRCIADAQKNNSATENACDFRSQSTETLPHKTGNRINRIGLNYINNSIVFVAGDRVFTRSSNQSIPIDKTDITEFKLDIDKSIMLQEAFEGLSELISLVPGVGWALLAHTISGFIREAFVKAGFTPDTVLMIVGKSGMLKSSYVPQITQLYNRSDGIKANSRFNSTKRYIEDSLFEYRNCTYVLDDIHTGSSSSIKKKNETTAEEIIRQISDNIGRGTKNGKELRQRNFEGNVVFIGEYTIGAESTLPRVLFVEISKRPNGKVLDKYQRSKSLLVSTFYSYFIQWYVDNFDDICKTIDIRLTHFRSSSTLLQIHGRLADAKFYLQMSQMVLLEFCIESNLITTEEAQIVFQRFEIYVSGLISVQGNSFYTHCKCSTETNYLSIIRELYHGGAFKLAKDIDEFDSGKHDGIVHYNCLCLRKNCLEKNICQRFGCDLKSLINSLKHQGALRLGNDVNTVQIKGGKRFYAIYLNKLE